MKKSNRCQAFIFQGREGNTLTLSETLERDTIVVSIQPQDGIGKISVRLDYDQFVELCDSNSYRGLTVEAPTIEEVPA